ncbi:hypothetical protein ABBQ32_005934 [Trebouxia sp. C0010 RCD-2024]
MVRSRTDYTRRKENRHTWCAMRGTAEEDAVSTSNGSRHAVDMASSTEPIQAVKRNGSTIIPGQGNGDGNGNGSGGSGDGGNGRGGDSPGEAEDPQPTALLLLLTIVAGSTSLYGIYRLVLAVSKLTKQRQSVKAADTADSRPHDDIAALKRLLREVFTNQLQMERRIFALEPEQEISDPFDTLTRTRKGWQAMSSTGKAKVQLSGSLAMGSALLYSKEQDGERAARSLDQAGVSTSTQMTVNLRTDLGGDQNGSLRVSCMLDAAQQQASLRQVVYETQPRPDLSLYLAPLGGQAVDAVMTLNAQAGQGVSKQVQQGCPVYQVCQGSGAVVNCTHQDKTLTAAHFRQVDGGGQDRNRTLLQLAANPLSSLCCALVAVRSTAPASTGPDSEQNHSSSAVVSRASSDSGLDPRPQGVASDSGSAKRPGTADKRQGAGWAFQGLKGPWSRAPGSNLVMPPTTAAPAAVLARHASTMLAVTGLWHWWEELAVSGWAAATLGEEQQGSSPCSVGLTLSSYPDGAGDAWAVSLSRQRSQISTAQAGADAELTLELSTQKAVADGITFTPGLVYAQRPNRSLLSLCCRSEWLF